MRKILATILATSLVAVSSITSYKLGERSQDNQFIALGEQVKDTVVGVAIKDWMGEPRIIGSGVLVASSGLILTCAHVMDWGKLLEVTIVFNVDGTRHETQAHLVDVHPSKDLALLQWEYKEPVKYAEVSRKKLKLGQKVFALGHPMGFEWTLTVGVISGLDRKIDMEMLDINLLQTDTVINPGSSGGALFNLDGELVGITNLIVSYNVRAYTGQSFAIPASECWKVLESWRTRLFTKHLTDLSTLLFGNSLEVLMK